MIRHVSREDEGFEVGGKTAAGKGFEVRVSEDGRIGGGRRQIDPAKLPKEIAKAIMKVVPAAKPVVAWKESEPEEGEAAFYVLELKAGRRRLRAEVGYNAAGGAVFGTLCEQVRVKDLPKVVAVAANKHFKPAEVGWIEDDGGRRVVEKITPLGEEEDEKERYFWELERPRRECVITADGKTARVVRPIPEARLPKAVRDAVRKRYAKDKLADIRKVTENGKVAYRMEAMFSDDDGAALVVTPEWEVSEEFD